MESSPVPSSSKSTNMINGFSKETADLTPQEMKVAEYMANRIKYNIGVKHAVTSSKMIKDIHFNLKVKLTGSRIRKIINHIRRNKMVDGCLVATSKGYYIETDKKEISKYVESLRQRANAINKVADVVQEHLN